MRASSTLCAAVAAISLLPTTFAWGAAGHEIVATIAQIYLHPTVLPKLCQILNWTSTNPNEPQCHLAPIASWADRIRGLPQYRWAAVLHFVEGKDDFPSETCAFPGERGWVNGPKNLLGGIRNVTGILEEWDGKDEGIDSKSNEALKFLVHFYGDLHMPLHTAGRERGGNGIHVLFDGRNTNLHSLWDNGLIAQRIRTLPSNYTKPLPFPEVEWNLRETIYDPYVRRLIWEGIMGRWKDEVEDWVTCPTQAHRDNSSSKRDGIFRTVIQGLFGSTTDVSAEFDDETLCPYAWAKPINQMNCEFTFPKELDQPPYSEHYRVAPPKAGNKGGPYLELDIPEYAGMIRREMVVEKLLAQGGIRLAATLNWLFADLEDDELTGHPGLRIRSI